MIETVDELLDVMARAHDPDSWGMGSGLSRLARVQRMKNALLAAQAEGAVMVPEYATDTMTDDGDRHGQDAFLRDIFDSMVSASPFRLPDWESKP